MFSVLDHDLHPYAELDDNSIHLEWRAPITPKQLRKPDKVNRNTKLRGVRGVRIKREDGSDKYTDAPMRKHLVLHSEYRQRSPPTACVTDYSFIRRDIDYEDFVTEIWHDQITRGWPKAIPYTTKQGINVAVRQCVSFISADDTAYYILLCGGIIGHTSARHESVSIRTLPRLFHKMRIRAVQALRKDITELNDGMPNDALMAGILAFAVQETVYDNDSREGPGWPKSPLARAQLLSWVGGLRRHSKHLEAFYRLLERRGGVQTVTEPGLRRMLSLCDLLTSSVAAAAPRYPIYGSGKSLIASGKLELDSKATELGHSFASKFMHFSSLSWQFLEPLADLLPDIRDVTLAVDMHQRTKGKRPLLGELVDFANSVHWKILSLCSQHEGSGCGSSNGTPTRQAEKELVDANSMWNMIAKQTLEPVRLATLIYSNLALFPVSHSAGVAVCLASSLRDLYEINQIRIYEPELEMWVLAMGCVASWGGDDRGWYLSRLKSMTDDLCWPRGRSSDDEKGPSQLVFLDIMRGFLWCEYVCLVPMREIWDEVYGSKAFR